MKKKLVGLMLSGMLVLSLAACGGDDAVADSTTVSTQAEVSTTSDTVAEEVTTEEVTTEEVTTEEVTVDDSTDSEEADSDGILYHLTMEEIPDLADTTWDFAGGMIDGTEMTEDEFNTALSSTYGGQLSFVFDGNGNAQMVQGGGSLNGTYEVRDDGLVAVVFDNNGSDLIYACFFTDMDGLTMIALSDESGNNGVYFVQQ